MPVAYLRWPRHVEPRRHDQDRESLCDDPAPHKLLRELLVALLERVNSCDPTPCNQYTRGVGLCLFNCSRPKKKETYLLSLIISSTEFNNGNEQRNIMENTGGETHATHTTETTVTEMYGVQTERARSKMTKKSPIARKLAYRLARIRKRNRRGDTFPGLPWAHPQISPLRHPPPLPRTLRFLFPQNRTDNLSLVSYMYTSWSIIRTGKYYTPKRKQAKDQGSR